MKTEFVFDFSTEIYMHNETGNVDTKQGWIDSIDDAEEVERSIESGVLADMDKETLAKLIMEKAAYKDDMEPDSYRNGQVEKTIAIHSGTGLPIVELHDDMMLAYVGTISLSDLCTGSVSENNYEPIDHRYRRIAERIFDSWESETAPDNVFICREKDKVIVLSEDEMKFVNAKCDDGDHSYYEELCDGVSQRFSNDFDEWEG